MDYQEYLIGIKKCNAMGVFVDELNGTMFFEEQFKLKWLATKLKQYSYVSFSDTIDLETVSAFSERCLKYTLKNYKGLPRGIQSGIVSFSILVGNKIEMDAIDFVLSRPKKHFAAFEMPIIVDLERQIIYHYTDTPIWGGMYYPYFRDYIQTHSGF